LVFAAKAFVNVSFVAALVLGSLRVLAVARDAPRHRVELGRWTVTARPDWSSLDDVRAIRAASGLLGGVVSARDRDALAAVAEAPLDSPLVRRVVSARRRLPDRVRLVLELRVPVAAVATADAMYVEVDAEAVALGPPAVERPQRAGRPLRLILGVADAARAPGGTFGADAVAAAQLCARLREAGDPAASWLDGVDVTNFGGRVSRLAPEVVVAATEPAGRGQVVWGRLGVVAQERGEPDFEAKYGRLRQALRLFPELRGVESANVAFDELVLRPSASRAPEDSGRIGARGR
jgi:hypothetical protein